MKKAKYRYVTDDEKHDILYFIKKGHSDKWIADKMDIKITRVKYVAKRYKQPVRWYCKVLDWLGVDYG